MFVKGVGKPLMDLSGNMLNTYITSPRVRNTKN